MNELDDFLCTIQSDELREYTRDWYMNEIWAEVETTFVKQYGVETECYED